MMTLPENVSAIGKAQVDAALRFAEIATAGAEKIAELNIKAAKAAFADGFKNMKSLSEAKDVSQVSTWASGTAQPGFEQTTAYGKSVYDVIASTGSELGSMIEEQVTQFNKQVMLALDVAAKSAPAGSETTIAAIKSVIGVANSVYDNAAKTSRLLAAMTETNVSTATQAGAVPRKKAA